MDRVYQANVSATPPTPPSPGAHGHVQSDVPHPLQATVPPTTPGPWIFHYVTESFMRVIEAAGLTPDATNLHQLADAVVALASAPARAPLDALSVQPAMAFSTRLLLIDYGGACMRVRRSSDNSEMDIGFARGTVDTAALLAFVGSGNGYITNWYNQTGSGIDAVQANASAQPLIVESGAVLEIGGFPAALFSTANGLVFNNAAGARLDFSLGAVFATTQSNGQTSTGLGYQVSGFLYADTSGSSRDFGFGNLGNTLTLWEGGAGDDLGPETGVRGATVINDGALHVGICRRTSTSGAVDVYLDGSLQASGTAARGERSDAAFCRIGSGGAGDGYAVNTSPFPAAFSTPEILVYASRLSDADVELLQAAQAAYHGG
ncbi:MAG TPA: arabinofuranosidase catalytic domain-containing protein [Burkholderiaceae bacterium]